MLPSEIIQELQKEIGAGLFYAGQSQADMLNLLNLDYLTKTGYLESVSSKIPSRNGLPIPWITYPALNFLETSTPLDSRILEFGAGASTFFWALRGNPVTYFEFERSWNTAIEKFFNELGGSISEVPVNLSVELSSEFSTELNESFAQELSAVRDGFSEDLNNYFVSQIRDANLIMIDGHFRNYFLQLCSYASPHTIVVLDNADRGEYLPGIDSMIQAGWRKIDFTGLGPINPYAWTTSIFSKSN
jgi:hypothetical protein